MRLCKRILRQWRSNFRSIPRRIRLFFRQLSYAAEVAYIAYTKDSRYDYYGVYEYLDFKLKHFMKEEDREFGQNGSHRHSPSYRSARLARKLIDRYKSKRHSRPLRRIEEKYGESNYWFTPASGSDEWATYHSDWSKPLTAKQRLQANQEWQDALRLEYRIESRDHRILMDIIHLYLRRWWI